jgi:hypothetical protein
MGFTLRHIEPEASITEQALLEGLQTAIPHATVQAVVSEFKLARIRKRKLSAEMGLLLVIAMNLFPQCSLVQVLVKLLKGFRYVWPGVGFTPATKGAICQLRYELGAKPVVELFHRLCQPMATPETPGAFLFGLRLMALDGTQENVADTPENEGFLGRHVNSRGPAGFPQGLAVYLIEVGSHAVVDAGLWPCQSHEHPAGLRLLRSVGEGMLLLWDCAYHSFDMAVRTRARGAPFLGRVPSRNVFTPVQRLADGSYLAYLYPSDRKRRRQGERLLVRIIEYTITDPALPGYGKRHRLMTSLLDETLYPALDLARAYHERWEMELTIDEVDTHQRRAFQPLRSKKPVGVIQEFYGLLLAHYVVRRIMFDAALFAHLDPDRISFTNALQLICDAIPEFQQTCPEQHEALYQRLLNDIARFILPERKTRVNPRVVKRKMSNFNLKRPEHRKIPQPTTSFAEAIAILN